MMTGKLEKIFNKIILTVHLIQRRYKLMGQFCKKCGHTMSYDYSMPSKDWKKLPVKYHESVLCFNCFVDEYSDNLNDLEIEWWKIK